MSSLNLGRALAVGIFSILLTQFAAAQSIAPARTQSKPPTRAQNPAPTIAQPPTLAAPQPPAQSTPASVQTDELAKSLNLTTSSKSLPVWSKPAPDAVTELSQVVRTASPAIFIVGKGSGFGTAFLISKQNRLLATNAHVADILAQGTGDMLAVQNGTSNVFKVVKAYYHPGVMRTSAGVILRTSSPSKGTVYSRSPDVAVLQLAEGGELPDELPLATRDELYNLFAQPVGMLGFPLTDNASGLPSPGEKAAASFREGVINRVSDFSNNAGGAPERQQYLQHSMANWFGFSGSAMFLPNGHVVALNNSGMTESQNGLSTTIAWGIRADCLWELLKSNNLLDKVKVPPEAAQVDIERFKQPDPELEKLRKVNQLLADAATDLKFSRYQAAIDKCNDAAKELPNYAAVYGTRGSMYLDNAAMNYKLKDPQTIQYNQLALADENLAVQLDPSNSDYYLEIATANCNLANAQAPTGKRIANAAAVQLADKIINDASMPVSVKTYAYRVRANGMAYSPDSLAYLHMANALMPSDWRVNWSLGIYSTINNNPKEAERYKALSHKYQDAIGKSDTAWKLSTGADAANRDGQRAFELASEACTNTDYKCYYTLAALAAAYAECNDFEHAVEYEQKALKLAPEHKRKQYTQHLASYQEHKPWRVK